MHLFTNVKIFTNRAANEKITRRKRIYTTFQGVLPWELHTYTHKVSRVFRRYNNISEEK